MNNEQQTKNPSQKRLSDFLFILWAGGAALLSYSLVYALRKPYTAAAFEDVEFFDMDYKVVVTISQIVGYVISKFMGIKLISELRREERLRFIPHFRQGRTFDIQHNKDAYSHKQQGKGK